MKFIYLLRLIYREIAGKILSRKVNTAALKFHNERLKEHNVELKSDEEKKSTESEV